MIKITKRRVMLFAVIAVLVAVAIVANVVAMLFWDYLMTTFGTHNSNTDTETVSNALALGDELVQEIAEDSMVLLKNENGILPLSENDRKVNLFGYGSTDNGFVYSGGGSGGTIINMDSTPDSIMQELKVTLAEAFEREGFEINKDLQKLYTDFSTYNATVERGTSTLYQPSSDVYTFDVLSQATTFSETAVVVISRNGSESVDIPLKQSKNNGKNVTDNTKTYLQLTTEEEEMLEIVGDYFEKVIVLLNTSGPIEAGFLNDENIDAALYVGPTGQSGTLAIPRLLKGYKEVVRDGVEERVAVTPSGRLASTYAYSTRAYEPTDANMWIYPHDYGGHGQISYTEDIYVGYKWYETADHEQYFRDVSNDYGSGYNGVVQYPFGYGLSYGTDFTYTVESNLAAGAEIAADTEIKIDVTVKNDENAKTAGRDVVQLYFTPEYYRGEIEKAHVNLLAFGKTKPLAPGQSQTLSFTIKPYDLACYDAYGKNPGDHTGYELDRGKYTIKLMTDAHTPAECENNEITYNVSETINIDKDPKTGKDVVNRFTGESAYMGLPIDGSTAGGAPIKYLSRADFAGTFPELRTPDRSDKSLIKEINLKRNDRYNTDAAPTTGADNGLYLVTKEDGGKASLADLRGSTGAKLKYNDELIVSLGTDYKHNKWNDLLDQLTASELRTLVIDGFFKTAAVESVGKPQRLDIDGPAGFHYPGAKASDSGQWIAYPAQVLIGCSWNQETAYNMGQAQGVLANATNVNGWYGPGLNMHRNPYSGRYFEYYSEDPIVVGKLASEVIRGATNRGLYCYMKHFAVSESGINPDNVKTWLTEQALRETYLKPFEIATKEGKANAVMTAFNCIGAVWAAACDPMNNDILRGEWGFNGSLLSDWASGRSWMDAELGVRGGNDLMLGYSASFSDTDPTSLACARTAAKNILYTFANTYATAKEYQENGEQDDRYKVELKMEIAESPFSPIPILMVVGVYSVCAAGIAVCVVFIVKKPKDKK